MSTPFKLISPVLVQPDTPISDCLRQMRAARTPVAVVLDGEGAYRGLFTDRDFFQKAHLIQKLIGAGREPLVRSCMDRLARPILSSQLHLASRYLLKSGKRYVAVIARAAGFETVLGVLPIEEVLRFHLGIEEAAGKSPERATRKIPVGVVSGDRTLNDHFLELDSEIYADCQMLVRTIDPGQAVTQTQIDLIGRSFNAIVLDVASVKLDRWVKMALAWLRIPAGPVVVILGSRQEALGDQEILRKLLDDARFRFQQRPSSPEEAARLMLALAKNPPGAAKAATAKKV